MIETMAVLEEEIIDVKKEVHAPAARSKKSKLPRFRSGSFWQHVFSTLIILSLSVGLLGLASLHKSLTLTVQNAIQSFNWMVLVKGNSLEVDEIGRFLKQLPGAKDVTFVSSQEAFAKLQADPLYFNDLSSFRAEDLPASWKVAWEPDPLDFSLLEVWADDARRLPAVVDLAFDPNTVLLIKEMRSTLYKLSLALYSGFLLAAFFSVLMLGRFFFFTPLSLYSPKRLGAIVLRDTLLWCLAGAVVYKLMGPFVWSVWLGGIVLGLLHAVWSALEKNS